MKRPPVIAETREFVQKNRSDRLQAERLSLRQNRLAKFLGWMLVTIVLLAIQGICVSDPRAMPDLRLFVFFLFPIPGILILRGSAGGLRFATATLAITSLLWFLWLLPALLGRHPVIILQQWISVDQIGFLPFGLVPLIYLTACLVMAVACLVSSRIKFATKPVIAFLVIVGLGIGIPWKIESNRAAKVRSAYSAELAAAKAFLIEKRFQDVEGNYPIGATHPQSQEIAPVFEKYPGLISVATYRSTISGWVVLYQARQAKGTGYYHYSDWVRMPSGYWLNLELRLYLSSLP
ncbi:hypothetical protein [Haloferula sp. BvORR071]|uniref:hypothetical protein n=1 Tax=Haloferula sp. BvORR071 TaxID=1396141 RepID=UPI00054FAE3D|nr:hypothetical protein [Haloferula sp. BvORR071]